MAEEYGWRIAIPDNEPIEYRAYAERNLKHQVIEFLVDKIMSGSGAIPHPYCIEIVQEWRELPLYSVDFMRFGGPGQELTLRLHISRVPYVDYILPRTVELEFPLYEKPRPKSFWERAKLAGKYVFGKYY